MIRGCALISFILILSSAITIVVSASPFCEKDMSGPTLLQRGAQKLKSERLDNFFYLSSRRYASDPSVLALANEIQIDKHTKVEKVFPDLTGVILVNLKNGHLLIDIPQVHLMKDGVEMVNGKVADTLNPRFIKIMTAVVLAAEKFMEIDKTISSVAFTSHVENETLANLLLDLGFGTPVFGRLLTRPEIHFILDKKMIPSTLYTEVDAIRKSFPNFQWAADRFEEARNPVEEKPLYSIPFTATVEIER